MATSGETLTDKEIINSLRTSAGADDSIRFLYRANFEVLGRYVVQNSGSWNDAEDIFQEVMISFIHLVQQGKFREESSIKTFLFSMTRNAWLNELKKRGRTVAREEKYGRGREVHTPGIDAGIEYRERSEALMQTLAQLGDNCRKILVLFYYENQSMKEILQHTEYENEQVLRNKKHKCLKKLSEMISSQKALYQQLKNWLHE